MKKLITISILLISITTFSQENELIKFQKTLVQVKNLDSLKAFNDEIKNIQKSNNTIDSIKKSTKWKLLCYTENGWTEIVGHKKTDINFKFVSKNKTIYTSEEVFKIFNLKYSDSLLLRFEPLVLQREDFYNRKTTPIINNNYLMFRYVHSYPNGNQTSWYNENIYYFKKEE